MNHYLAAWYWPLNLCFTYHYLRTPEEWLVPEHPGLKVDMNMSQSAAALIKNHLRLGAYAGAGAVVRPAIRDDRRSYRLTGLGH